MRAAVNRYLWVVTLAVMQLGCDFLVETATEEAKPLSYVGQIRFGNPMTHECSRRI